MKKIFVITLLALCGAAAFGQQAKLVVTPFENRGAKLDAAALNNLQDYLINAFINTGRFQVPDRNALALLAQEQKFQLSDWADDSKSAQMGKVLNADYIARVIVMHDGEYNLLTARILDVNTANGLSAAEMEFMTQREARGKMDDFVSGILQRIGGGGGGGGTQTKQTGQRQYKIGDTGPGGGIVFYVEGNGGMEVGSSLGEHTWNDAINVARNYKGGGMNDWRLPSMAELNLVYVNLQKAGLVQFPTGRYWSSSQHSNYHAWLQNFGDGRQVISDKGSTGSVRAVRAF